MLLILALGMPHLTGAVEGSIARVGRLGAED
jgi:hypothetical protein